MSGTQRPRLTPPIDATRDWAMVRLAKPICRTNALKLSDRRPEDLELLTRENRVYQVGYHRDLKHWRLALGGPCPVARTYRRVDWRRIRLDFTEPSHLILHTCDTGGASSGSPLLAEGDDGLEVVGINVGTYVFSRAATSVGKAKRKRGFDAIANTAVSSMFLGAKLKALQSASILSRRGDIRDLQERLADAGYAVGALDGRYGRRTRAAILDLERGHGLEPTGLATQLILDYLRARQSD